MSRQALIVDDDPEIRTLLAGSLSALGLSVTEAPEAWTALQRIEEQPPDLVCVDLMLPGISGLELCERIRSEPELVNLKLLVISARTLPQDRALALEAGADLFLAKPFGAAELAAAVGRLLDGKRKRGVP